MRASSTFLLLAASLAFASAVSAGDRDKQKSPTASGEDSLMVEIDVDNLVEGRRAGYWMSAGLFGGMFGVINSGGDVRGLELPARTLAGWAKALSGMFPEGSINDQSNALPTVWTDRENFEATAALYAERAARMAEIAKSGDSEAFKTQWSLVRETCSSCHDRFRRDRSKEAQGQN